MKNDETVSTLKKWYGFDMRVVLESIIVGGIVGFVIVLFRICLSHLDEIRTLFYENLHTFESYKWLLWIGLLFIIAFGLKYIMKKVPLAAGSGIPQIKGFLLRQIKLSWFRELITKFFGGILALGTGLSLGREGPSVQMGANIGLGCSRLLKRFHTEEKYLVTAGASAGLAAAFNAPLAGVIFALEELHKNFASTLLICTMAASVTADFVASQFFGLKPIFTFENVEIIELNQYGYIVILGICIGLLGKLFNSSLLVVKEKMSDLFAKKNKIVPYIAIIISIIIGVFYPKLLGGGHELINELSVKHFALYALLIVFVIKLLFTIISYGSNVPGGIFLPILVLGAIVGKSFGDALSFIGLEEIHTTSYLILGMAAFFTAVVKAPITGSILITEMTGSFNHLLPLIIVSLVAYIITDVLESKPIYDSLLEKMLKNHKGNWLKKTSRNKIIMEIPIRLGSEIEHKKIKDIEWPINGLIVGIKRGENEIIPNGESKLYVGDVLVTIVDENYATDLKIKLLKLAGSV